MATKETMNYTLGRGELHLATFQTGTKVPSTFRYIGNAPSLALAIESENLDHFNSDGGIRQKDFSMVLEVTRSATLTTDHVSPENLGMFLFGEASTVTTAAATGLTETVSGVVPGEAFKLGVDAASAPAGVMGLDPATFDVQPSGGGTAFVVDTDYELDADTGMLHILKTGSIVAGVDLDLTYDLRSSTRTRVVAGEDATEGALLYIAYNPAGDQVHYYIPYVKVTPNGDFALKGDELQTLPFNVEILKLPSQSAIYAEGEPIYA